MNKIYTVVGVVIFGLLLAVSWYRSSLLDLEAEVARVKELQALKVEYIDKVIEVEKIVYKDRIKYIKEYVYDKNKTDCENAIGVIRRTHL
jgi:hypothetical protein